MDRMGGSREMHFTAHLLLLYILLSTVAQYCPSVEDILLTTVHGWEHSMAISGECRSSGDAGDCETDLQPLLIRQTDCYKWSSMYNRYVPVYLYLLWRLPYNHLLDNCWR